MSDKLNETLKEMAELAKTHKIVLVGYSGGKDSLATLDLALRFFDKVIPYHMYLVPHLEVDESRFRYCKQRFNMEVIQVPHFYTVEAWKSETYCDPLAIYDLIPDLTQRHVYDWLKAETGATLILNGQKKADGLFRRRLIAKTKDTQNDVYRPLKNWLRWEVLSYLKGRDIEVPASSQAENSAVSLAIKEVLWLYDNHRQDYERVKSFFPYIEAIVVRRELFGRTDG